MNVKAPGYIWFAQDILLSRRVDKLTAEEECWYRRGLDFSWIDGGLPTDPTEVADRIKKGCTVEAAVKLLGLFFVQNKKDVTKMVNEKQEILRKKYQQKVKKLAKAGRASAAKRAEEKRLQEEREANKRSTNVGQMKGQYNPIISNPIIKEEEKKEEAPRAASKAKTRGSRIPNEFFVTPEQKAWAAEECPMIDWKTETKKFCNHYRSVTGRGAVKLDWGPVWENWMLNARDKFGGATNGTNQKYPQRKSNVSTLEDSDAYFREKYGEDAIEGGRDGDIHVN